jgi:hypothetical protein
LQNIYDGFFMSELLRDLDFYDDEYHQFQWDVHILIQGTLDASVRYLDARAPVDLANIKAAIEKSQDTEYQHYLVDEHVEVLETNSQQERFLRNMALVALASRLTHALRTMSRSSESFSPRRKRYGSKNMSEFSRLWVEYAERFGIDFSANADRVEFVETMREVRNQIVHDGAEANTFKPNDEIDWHADVVAYLDCSFSEKYPGYVSGDEVSVSREQLDKAIEASVNLVGWLAKELRKRELASIRKAE